MDVKWILNSLTLLLLLSYSPSNTSLLTAIIKYNLNKLFQKSVIYNNPYPPVWIPEQSSHYLFPFPFSPPVIVDNRQHFITPRPVINWQSFSSDNLMTNSSKPKISQLIDSDHNLAAEESKRRPKYAKLINELEDKIPIIKSNNNNHINDSNKPDINYEIIVDKLQTKVMKNISSVIDNKVLNESKKSKIDYKNIINNLQEKELRSMYDQEKVFSPHYQYGFKPLSNQPNSLRKQIKSYLKLINNDTEHIGSESNSIDKNQSLSQTIDNKDKNMKKYSIRSEPLISDESNKSDDENDPFIGYKIDIIYDPNTIESDLKNRNNLIDSKSYGIAEQFDPSHYISEFSKLSQFRAIGHECARDYGWCDFDNKYPNDSVNKIVSNCSKQLSMMYIEIPDNLSDFDDYQRYNEIKPKSRKRNMKQSLCDSENKFVRPSYGQDINGNYYIILQTRFYYQTVPVGICKNPGNVCNGIGDCGPNVRCTQKYRTHLLISLNSDRPEDCPQMRLYRLPAACVCQTSINS